MWPGFQGRIAQLGKLLADSEGGGSATTAHRSGIGPFPDRSPCVGMLLPPCPTAAGALAARPPMDAA
ncbi:hypothetical protein AB0D27_41915 [Streptomyces sp. NPDC048415]|jgi:hypothetical protein|uniref:hypothetical protein n=1 Tax=Streptomyces sp. NPDC048415 TaxID=3154822 RepID=UPI00342C8BF5